MRGGFKSFTVLVIDKQPYLLYSSSNVPVFGLPAAEGKNDFTYCDRVTDQPLFVSLARHSSSSMALDKTSTITVQLQS